jgi:hypothetical protein
LMEEILHHFLRVLFMYPPRPKFQYWRYEQKRFGFE